MKCMLCSIGYLSGQDLPILPTRDSPRFGPARKISVYGHMINPLLTKLD